MLMTMLDLGFSGTALGVASAASGFADDPLVGPDGVAAFCPASGAVPVVAGAEGDAEGDVLWPEAAGATLGLVAEVPGLEGEGCPWGAVAGAVAAGAAAEGDPLGFGSAPAGSASIMAKNGTARNCGKEAVKRIC